MTAPNPTGELAIYSSIYHFFVVLLHSRGYFSQNQNLEEFEFPESLIAAQSKGAFPDIVLRSNASTQTPGGELIELKTANSYSISSINSTIPTQRKVLGSLSKSILQKMAETGESIDPTEEREIFYLIVGRNMKVKPAPLTKVCLVSGAFFETIPAKDLLMAAAREVNGADAPLESSILAELSGSDLKERFAKTRTVDGSSIKIRFRVMTEASSETNLLNSAKFPMVGDDTISLLVPLTANQTMISKYAQLQRWDAIQTDLIEREQHINLSMAIDDIDPSLKDEIRVAILQHPVKGNFLISQMILH